LGAGPGAGLLRVQVVSTSSLLTGCLVALLLFTSVFVRGALDLRELFGWSQRLCLPPAVILAFTGTFLAGFA
jgi:hypothetical protein